MATGSVEGEELEGAQALAEGVLGGECLELTQQALVAAESEIRVDALLDRPDSELVESGCLRPDGIFVPQIGVRESSPPCQRRRERRARLDVRQRPGPMAVSLELGRVDRHVGGIEPVARSLGDDRSIGPEASSQVGDVHLEGLAGGEHRIVAPERVDELIGADHGAGVRDQEREHEPRLRAAEIELRSACGGPNRAEHSDLEP